jgi:type II secretory ATPase GspE/PulE/Tfp pilus assembly ATPase PilB-like protein
MGRIIDFHSRRVLDKSQNGGQVLYDPDMPIATEIFIDLDKSVLLDECWVPLSWDMNGIVVLIDDPRDEEKKARIKKELRTQWVIFKIGTKADIESFIHLSFKQLEIDDYFQEAMSGKRPMDAAYLVDTIIADAYLRKVSEVHFEMPISFDILRVRFLMDGELCEYMVVPGATAIDMVKRIRTMARLDKVGNNLPGIGHIKFKHDGLPEFQIKVTSGPTDDFREYIVVKLAVRQNTNTIDGNEDHF